mmetsp:Transcript_31443/g.31700  ORF Transcript_31443/g.31700 Transcript_31443/m.31700 type:complete len:586 (-) Transcript_31443:111-1868(-)
MSREKAYRNLEAIYEKSCDDRALLFQHPDDYDKNRDFKEEDLEILKKRDFKTRLFICTTTILGDSVFLSTHFTDNLKHQTHFNFVRDYVKTLIMTKNWTAATSVLTDLLTMVFKMEPSAYNTFACTLASALSDEAANTDFEVSDDLLRYKADAVIYRRKFIVLMRIIFDKISTKRFLVDNGATNIYRDIHCMNRVDRSNWAFAYFFFCFLLQICLVCYVIVQNLLEICEFQRIQLEDDCILRDEWYRIFAKNPDMVPLALLSTIFSAMRAHVEMTEALKISYFYGSNYLLKSIDLIVNVALPFILLITGFTLITTAPSFIDAVLNATALGYISAIDDMLPGLLQLPEAELIMNCLIQESIEQFLDVTELSDEEINGRFNTSDPLNNIHFNDIYVTNMPEQGNDIHLGKIFMPHFVKKGKVLGDVVVGNSEFVTDHCLLRRVEWRYTKGFPKTSRPRVAYLKIWKLNGEVLEVKQKDVAVEDLDWDMHQSVEGVYIITVFQMSESVILLRLCGSKSVDDFERAFKHYSLWDFDKSADKLLSKMRGQVIMAPLSDSIHGEKVPTAENQRERRKSFFEASLSTTSIFE